MDRKKYRLINSSIKALVLCIKEMPVISTLLMMVYTIKALVVILNINMLQQLFEGIQDCLDGKTDMKDVHILVGLMLMYMVIQHVMNALTNIFQVFYINKGAEKITYKLHKEINNISPIFFEDTENLDLLHHFTTFCKKE